MSDVRDILRNRIRELADEESGLTARLEGLVSEIQRLQREQIDLITRRDSVRSEAHAAKDGLALIEEQLSGQATDTEIEVPATPPVQPDPVAPAPAPAVKETPAPTGRSRDPLSVRRIEREGTKNQPSNVKRPRHYNTEATGDLSDVSEVWLERADAVYILLEEHGAMSQVEIAAHLPELVDGFDPTKGSPFVSECIRVLKIQNRILWTGQHKEKSPVWKAIVSAAERASAGLGIEDDNFAGRTSNPPDRPVAFDGPGRVAVDSSAFEQGKRR